jgi:glycosyltransferase involved in cell wall biosynthesis
VRILMISDVYFPRVNGVSTSIQTFRRALAERGHASTLLAPAYPPSGGAADDGDIVRVPARGVWLDPEDRMMRPVAALRCGSSLGRAGYDVVHVQTPFVAHHVGVRLARRLGLPTVETYHTLFEEYLGFYAPFLPGALLRPLARQVSRWQCNRMQAVVVPSTAMQARLEEYGVRSPLRIVPTGVPVAQLGEGDGVRFRERHGIEPGQPVLAFIGRVAHEKNIGFLLRMLVEVRRELADTLLVVAGEGPALESLQGEARALGLGQSVRFVGYLSRDRDLPDCYRAADAFVFASRTETQGLVLLEAMALGVPVVATAVMGTRDILLPGRGARVAPEDAVGFAAEVLRLLRDPDLRERLGAEGREYVREWSPQACAGRLLGVYEEAIARRAAERG